MTIQIITPKTSDQAIEWYDRAHNTLEIARFLNVSFSSSTPNEFGDDWTCLTLMDTTCHGLLRLRPARSFSNLYCDISCWVLPTAGDAKSFIAGSLLRAGFEQAANRFGSKYVDWCVHGTNEESLKFSRRNAKEIGNVEEGAWDIKLGRWVPSITFRKNVEAYRYENQFKTGRTSRA